MIKKYNIRELKTKLLLIICGFIVFSPLSSVITIQYFNLPIALPEILFFPFILLLRKRLDLKVKITKMNIRLFFIFILTLSISFIIQKFKIGSILSTSRGYFYMLLSYAIFNRENNTTTNDIMLICLGSVLGWCLLSINQFIQLTRMISTDGSLGVYGNLVALALLISIAIINKNKKIIILSILLGLILSLTTGLRRQIIIFVLSIILSYVFILTANKRNVLKYYFSIIVFSLSLFFAYPIASNYIYNVSPLLHQRIFSKSEQFMSGEYSESDNIRSNFIKDFITNFDEYILPRGFVSKRTMEDIGTGIFMDFPFLELSYMLGLFFLTIFFIFYFKNILNHVRNYYCNNRKESAIWATLGIILFVLLFLEGSNLNYSYITPFTGMILGKLTYNNIV